MNGDNNFKPSWGYVWGIRMLVASSAVGFVTVWLVGWYKDGIQDRATFVMVNSLAIVAFIITVVTAFTNRETAAIMRRHEKEAQLQRQATQDTVKLTESIVKEMESQRQLTTFQIAQTNGQITAARDQVVQMIGQGDIMKEQLRLTENTFYLAERAYVKLKRFRLLNPPFEANKDPIIACYVVNGGKTPAYNLTVSGHTAFDDKIFDLKKIGERPTEKQYVAAEILPGDGEVSHLVNNQTLNPGQLLLWRTNKIVYWVKSILIYFDIRERERTVTYWHSYEPFTKPEGEIVGSFIFQGMVNNPETEDAGAEN